MLLIWSNFKPLVFVVQSAHKGSYSSLPFLYLVAFSYSGFSRFDDKTTLPVPQNRCWMWFLIGLRQWLRVQLIKKLSLHVVLQGQTDVAGFANLLRHSFGYSDVVPCTLHPEALCQLYLYGWTGLKFSIWMFRGTDTVLYLCDRQQASHIASIVMITFWKLFL